MEWREVIEHPSLKDLPFKIETNEWGNIVMTPASYGHAAYQSRIFRWLVLSGLGEAIAECPVQTSKGVRVADVAWASAAFHKKYGPQNLSLPESPEIIVAVLSPANSAAAMEDKKKLYFEVGAGEFWLCNQNGDMRFFDQRGELKKSGIFPDFPDHIDIHAA
jgi:Uma2 family endonuclease